MTTNRTPDQILRGWVERDLGEAARAGQLPSALEIDDLVHEVFEILDAGRCPVLTGEPGVGKSALVYEIVRRSSAGEGPARLRNRRFWQVSLKRTASTFKTKSEAGDDFQQFIDLISDMPDRPILFFRDVDRTYALDLESHLSCLAYERGALLIGEGSAAVVQSMMEFERGLEASLFLFNIPEPSVERCLRLLHAWNAEQAASQGWNFTAEALEESLALSRRFQSRKCLPGKAIDLLAQVGVVVHGERPATSADVIDRFCAFHHTPRVLLDPAVPLDLTGLEDQFAEEVLGQREAVSAVVNMIGLVKAGLSDMSRPFGVFLFVGPTGVGKTHLAQRLAEYLFGSRDRMIRLNMTDYPDAEDAGRLFGEVGDHRPEYARGILAARLTRHPFAVLLLDEFEKSHTKVHDRFLQLFDEGQFINGAGELISCRSTIIIATSNAGAGVYRGGSLGFRSLKSIEKLDREVDRLLESHFRVELLNRFDHIVHFHPLSREDIRAIALRELERLRDRAGLQRRRLSLEVDESVLDWLTAHGYDPEHGARLLRRTIEKAVTAPLADAIVRRNPDPGTRIALGVRGNRVVADLIAVERPSPPRPPRQTVSVPAGKQEETRVLDRGGLLDEARRIFEEARAWMRDLQEKRNERSSLIEQMNQSGFWDRTDRRRETLARFRELDVAIRSEDRLETRIRRLEPLDHPETAPLASDREIAQWVEDAAKALRDWGTRLAEEGGSALWMMISNVDPFEQASTWIQDLARMELAWCRSLHLVVNYSAAELVDDLPTRVVLAAEGPGAAVYLAAEAGLHRQYRKKGSDWRARIDLIPMSADRGRLWPELAAVRDGAAVFGMASTHRGRLMLEGRGLVLDLHGHSADSLSHLLFDLESWSGSADLAQPAPARIYGADGVGARDPRTGATVLRLKDVLGGRLERFLEAWQAQPAPAPEKA